MGDPVTTAIAAVVVGSAVNAGVSYHQSEKAEDAANAANARAQAAADTAAATSSSDNAAQTTNTKQAATSAVDTSARRRMSFASTRNRYAANGLLRTLN